MALILAAAAPLLPGDGVALRRAPPPPPPGRLSFRREHRCQASRPRWPAGAGATDAVKRPHRCASNAQVSGRGGKGVSVITGLPLPPAELEALASELRKRCGCGGTVRNGTIEIQGDHRDRLVQELIQRGYSAKRSGG
ncbi:MAG: stress response translation initiation inhibitor YciH [Betaproteobacteria bacterium]|nr:stress response translation initiation inhibitor YciH [Betaproteobacteria bacterium]